jgi:hypothetical protein
MSALKPGMYGFLLCGRDEALRITIQEEENG